MNEDILAVLVVAVVLAGIAIAVYWSVKRRELALVESRYRSDLYGELFDAMTDLNRSTGDDYKVSRAKARLSRSLNRINLCAGPHVLTHVNELLDFLNQHRDREFDVTRLSAICNSLVLAIRKEAGDPGVRTLEEQKARFRFYIPPRK